MNMSYKILMILLISSTQITLITAQKNKDLSQDLAVEANHFIEKLKNILNEGHVEALKSELIVNKAELRHFLDQEWKRKYNAHWRNEMKDKFEPSVDKGWKEIQRKDGYHLLESFIKEADLVKREKIINPIWKNAKFSDITVNYSEEFDMSIGEISMLKLIHVNANIITDSNPVYHYKLTFPCILTSSDKLKIVGSVNGQLISANPR
jgi:hypothetical protein